MSWTGDALTDFLREDEFKRHVDPLRRAVVVRGQRQLCFRLRCGNFLSDNLNR
jgi:hypothetical protein